VATTNVKGLSELQAVLNTLPAKLERNIMRSALRQGANVIMQQARANLSINGSVDSGLLRKGIKVSTSAKGGTVIAKVRATGPHAYIAHWLEYGVQPHSTKKGADVSSGKLQDGKLHRGFTESPFLRPALDTEMQAATIAIGNSIKKVLLKKHGLDTPQIEVQAE
jgi:hypothetical protein